MITVEADTLDAALWKACLVLDCASDEIAYVEAEPINARVRLNALTLTRTDVGTADLEPAEELSEPLPLKPQRRIEEDIVPSAGRVIYFGDLAIFGCVRAGAHVRARGKITIWGDVELSATVVASESIIIKGGLLGTARAIRGDVACRYSSGAAIVGRNITITEDAIQSRIVSSGKIDVGGMLCGGVASGRLQVDAAIIGSTHAATQTRVTSGQSKRLAQLAEQAAELQALAQSEWTIRFYAANAARLLSLSAEFVDARITAHETIHPGSRVQIDQASLEIEREMRQASFWKDADTGMLMMSHHEYA